MKQDVVDNIIKDKDFLKKIINLTSTEEVKKAFKEKGLDISEKDLETIGELIKFQIENAEKIHEFSLEKVVGGWSDEKFEKFKNISIGISSLAIAMSVVYLAANAQTLSGNIDDRVSEFGSSWIWRIFTTGGQTTKQPKTVEK